MENLEEKRICDECACQPVCGVYRATGGITKCSDIVPVTQYVKRVRAEAHQVVMTMRCGRCGAYVLEYDHLCPQCGAAFDGSVE